MSEELDLKRVNTPVDFVPDILRGLKVDRKSAAYRRAMYAGFKIEEVKIRPTAFLGDGLGITLELPFECACGTREYFIRSFSADDIEMFLAHDRYFTKHGTWDGALEIEHQGALSADHLRKDGYSEEAIKEIRYIYDLEEEVKILRRENQIMQSRLGIYEYSPLKEAS